MSSTSDWVVPCNYYEWTSGLPPSETEMDLSYTLDTQHLYLVEQYVLVLGDLDEFFSVGSDLSEISFRRDSEMYIAIMDALEHFHSSSFAAEGRGLEGWVNILSSPLLPHLMSFIHIISKEKAEIVQFLSLDGLN